MSDEQPASGAEPADHETQLRDSSASSGAQPKFTGHEAPPGERVIGPYRLIERIGEGGMGQVWLAEQSVPVRRRVALKLIRGGHYDGALLQRFEAERQALAMMEHPAIAKVLDAGTTPDGQPYFVMEYVDGLPITTYCDENRLSLEERLLLFVAVCEGVQHAHLKSIIHRDLKPSNVLVLEVDGRPAPRIIDFGIAKAVTAEGGDRALLTEVGGLVGTLGYMSPEQADPAVLDIDTRADVYALGVILYELMTGSKPFEVRKAPLDEVLRRLREDDPPPLVTPLTVDSGTATSSAAQRGVELRQLKSALRGDLDSIAMKTLARERDRRYGTPVELAADIRRYLQNQPVEARPASAGYRLRKYVRRHRLAVTLGAAMVLLAAGSLVAQYFEVKRATRERDRADRIAAFMTGMFESVDPGEKGGAALTAREVLDKAAGRIEQGTDLDPIVQARLMYTLAHTYGALGLWARAEELIVPAIGLQKRVLGPEDRQTLHSMSQHGEVLLRRNSIPEAEALLRATLETQQRVLGKADADTLDTMDYLGGCLASAGHFDDAEKLLLEAIRLRKEALGPDDDRGFYAQRDFVNVLVQQGRAAEAEKIGRPLYENQKRVLGIDHPGVLYLERQLAWSAAYQGRDAEAERVYRDVWERSKGRLGPDHESTLSVLREIIEMARRQGRYDEALAMGRELLAAQLRRVGAEDLAVYGAYETLAVTLGTMGQLDESAELVTKALAGYRRVYGADSPRLLQTTMNVAFTLSYAKRHAEADPYYREAIRLSALSDNRDARSNGWLAYAIGATLAGHHDQALECLRKSLDAGLGAITQLETIADLDPLHGDPRFAALVEEVRKRARPPE